MSEHNADIATPALTAAEAQSTIVDKLPPVDHHGEIVEEVGHDSLRLRLPFNSDFVGAEPWQHGKGTVFSGPTVMGFADTAMYCCLMAALGKSVIPVIVNLNISFITPVVDTDLIANARIIRRGGRLHYLECWLSSEGSDEPCAHVTSTYRVSRYAE